MMEFMSRHSHEIFCWSLAVVICVLLFTVMLLVDYAWNVAYQKGFDKGLELGKTQV